MAISNALGSQNLNLFVGLGLPWLLITVFTRNEGIMIRYADNLILIAQIQFGICIGFLLMCLLSWWQSSAGYISISKM